MPDVASHLRRMAANQLYHRMAQLYDAVAAVVSDGLWFEWVRIVIPYIRGPRVLEVGFGTGHLLHALSRISSIHSIGLDESQQMTQITRRLTGAALPLIRGRVQNLPLQSECLQTVVSTFPTEFASEARTLAEIQRVLRSGGTLLLLPAARIEQRGCMASPGTLLRALTGASPRRLQEALRARFLPALVSAGFEARLWSIRVRHSTAFLIVATKPAV